MALIWFVFASLLKFTNTEIVIQCVHKGGNCSNDSQRHFGLLFSSLSPLAFHWLGFFLLSFTWILNKNINKYFGHSFPFDLLSFALSRWYDGDERCLSSSLLLLTLKFVKKKAFSTLLHFFLHTVFNWFAACLHWFGVAALDFWVVFVMIWLMKRFFCFENGVELEW